jgi:putative transposase
MIAVIASASQQSKTVIPAKLVRGKAAGAESTSVCPRQVRAWDCRMGFSPSQPEHVPIFRFACYNSYMTEYRRATLPGGYYFFTVVTHRRRKLFLQQTARDCLRYGIDTAQKRSGFENIAMCLMPEHLHCIWKLPDGDADFSSRWSIIKTCFTRRYRSLGGLEISQSKSRSRKRERGMWQRRFWEHQIRDQTDLQRHIDYIHYNPVKHRLVLSPEDWPWSTYHRYVEEGFYKGQDWKRIKADISRLIVGE